MKSPEKFLLACLMTALSLGLAPYTMATGNTAYLITGDQWLCIWNPEMTEAECTYLPYVMPGSSSSSLAATISNTGTADLDILISPLSDTTNFTLIGTTSATIPPGGKHTVALTFNPTQGGRFTANLAINSDDPTVGVSLNGKTFPIIEGFRLLEMITGTIDRDESRSYPREIKEASKVLLNWHGSTMKLSIHYPDGRLYDEALYAAGEGEDAWIEIDVLDPQDGRWKISVIPVDIPGDNYPFVLTIYSPEAASVP